MFFTFFDELRAAKVPVTLKEYLALMEALSANVIDMKIDEFYVLARTVLVKDERNLDKFDRVFGHAFKGLENVDPTALAQLPEDWLKALTEKFLSEEEKKQIEALGGWEKLMEELKKRLEEQKKRHEGGNKAIGTGGTSPFGNNGYNPEGVRIGQDKGRHGKAVKVWDKREYKNLDDNIELGTRNIKVALRRLRKWARTGAETELDLPNTIKNTANKRRHNEKTPTWDVLHKFGNDYKIIFIGDATMSPYEITYPGGSVEHWNEEAGAVWVQRVAEIYPHMVWLNPVAEKHWDYTPSIQVLKQLVNDRMFPLTLDGLDRAMRELNR